MKRRSFVQLYCLRSFLLKWAHPGGSSYNCADHLKFQKRDTRRGGRKRLLSLPFLLSSTNLAVVTRSFSAPFTSRCQRLFVHPNFDMCIVIHQELILLFKGSVFLKLPENKIISKQIASFLLPAFRYPPVSCMIA